MRYILCQPALLRFQWELEVCITRLHNLGVTDIVLLFAKYDDSVPPYFEKYGCEIHVYPDNRSSKRYIPSIKPYLWMKFLEEDQSRENESYFYMDADVILREIPNVEPNPKVWTGSDCSAYLSTKYIDSKGNDLLAKMCSRIGIDYHEIREQNPVAGAQWVICNPILEYWKKVYLDSVKLYAYLDAVESAYCTMNPKGYVPIQKWTAEMWAQLWNLYYFGMKSEVSKELDFCWPTDKIERYNQTKIMHNAGVVDDRQGLFFKGQYVDRTPYGDDFSFVKKDMASWAYVQALEEVNTK